MRDGDDVDGTGIANHGGILAGGGDGAGFAAMLPGVPRLAALAILALSLLAAPAAADDAAPFAGFGPLDPGDPAHRDAGRIARFEGLGRSFVVSAPIRWDALDPKPQGGGAPKYAWKALDEAVLVWQLTGLEPVLVLSPACRWAQTDPAAGAWAKAVRKALDPIEAEAALRGVAGATPPKPVMWTRWERLVKAVVERYDGDGTQDMPGLRRPVRHLQLLGGIDPAYWQGEVEQLLRLMHHALEGARGASEDCRLLAPTVDLRATGYAPHPDAREWAYRIGQATPGSGQPLARMEVQRHFAIAQRLLEMPRLYDIFCQRGSAHAADDRANLAFLRRTLDAGGGTGKGLWLLDNPTRKLGPARDPSAVPARKDEQRLRQRWLPAARNPRHAQHGRALAWLRKGQAYDLIRGLGRARAAGADAVLFQAPFDALPAGVPGAKAAAWQGLLEERPGEGKAKTLRATPSWFALAQARRLLRGHRGAAETPIGAPGRSVIFQFGKKHACAWISIVMLDARLSWAGEPGAAPPIRSVLITLPSGTYTLEWVRTGPEAPKRKEVVSDGSLALELGPSPVYIIPKSR